MPSNGVNKLILKVDNWHTVALQYTDGKPVKSQNANWPDQVRFLLVDGRTVYLAQETAEQIHALGIRPREEFELGKIEVMDGHRRYPREQVKRLAAPAAAEPAAPDPGAPDWPPAEPPDWPEPPPEQPGSQQANPPGHPPAGPQEHQASPSASGPNGRQTQGNTPPRPPNGQPPRTINPNLPIPPTLIPIDQAALASVLIMKRSMKLSGEQWSDEARQAFATSILIAMERRGWLCLYRPESLAEIMAAL